VLTQSKRHGFIASLLNIPHILVAVNKMDLVDYSQQVYAQIVQEYSAFAAKLSLGDLTFIPISALQGDNVVHKSTQMPWYDGPTLLHHLEHVNVGASRNLVDFRFPVQLVVRPHQDLRGFAGQVASGTIRPGEEIVVLPSGQTSRVRSVLRHEQELVEAVAGDAVLLTLEDEIDVSRGDLIVRRHNLPQRGEQLECLLCWLSEEPLNRQVSYLLQHTTRTLRAHIAELTYRIDVDTLHRSPAHTLRLNEIGRVTVQTTQPLFFDPYQLNRSTGSFILIDPFSHATVGAGLIRRRAGALEELAPGVSQSPRTRPTSRHVVWERSALSREQREVRNGHRAAVLWFTGLSGSGKSTVARALEQRLFSRGCQTMYLDGDNVRHGLCGDLGFSPQDRQENIRRVAEVAKLGFEQGQIVLCTFISPYGRDRAFARSLVPEERFVEIYIECDLEVCKRRDPKGLYAKALSGEIADFTGISSPYEPPEHPELVLQTDLHTVDALVDRVLEELVQRGLIPEV
jgi:bifunctional enzyme CysN/CysC